METNSIIKQGISPQLWKTVVRPFILNRDDYVCQKCGTSVKLEVHSKSGKHLNANDLITLCKECHGKVAH